MLRQARNDRIDANDSAEPIENADATDPIEPIERADPTDPIESTESREPIERSESCDQSDHFEFSEPACTRPILKPGHPAARGRPAAGALTLGPTEPESVPKPGPDRLSRLALARRSETQGIAVWRWIFPTA
jgi:hypothetical protein